MASPKTRERIQFAATRAAQLAVRRRIEARYDAAQTTESNRRHWAMADNLSADAANSPEVRRVLRNRARYECSNNGYARGLSSTLANDTVVKGPRLQLYAGRRGDRRARELGNQIEQSWHAWALQIQLGAKLRVMREAVFRDGESFALLVNNPALPGPIQLDLRVIEADQVSTPDLFLADPQQIDGIRYDRHGNPTEYHVLRQHPGALGGWHVAEYDRVPAAAVVHLYREERAGQRRGIPEMTPALPLYAQLRRYTLACVTAAENAARMAQTVETNQDPDESDTTTVKPEVYDTIELDASMATVLPDGYQLKFQTPSHPTVTYGEFKREILAEIGRAVDVPIAIVGLDSSRHNYSSTRADFQAYDMRLRVDRDWMGARVLNPVLSVWLDEAALIPGLIPAGAGPIATWHRQWFFTSRGHVDPAKEAAAAEIRARTLSSFQIECAREGHDWEEILEQQAAVAQRRAELGLPAVEAGGAYHFHDAPEGATSVRVA